MEKVKFYNKKWFAILMLIVFAPVGIILIWTNEHFEKKANMIISVVFTIWFAYITLGQSNETETVEVAAFKEKVEVKEDVVAVAKKPELTEEEKATIEIKKKEDDKRAEEERVKAEEVKVAKEAKEAKKKEDDQKAKTEVQKGLEAITLATLRENFGQIADIELKKSEQSFVVTPKDPSFTLELLEMMNGTKSQDDWVFMTDNFVGLSKSISVSLGSGYLLSIVNPVNADNFIFSVMDGVVIYDVFND